VGFVEPLVLVGERVVLEPLEPSHHDALVEAASDGQLWTLGYTNLPRPEQMRDSIAHYLGQQAEGLLMPFTVRLRDTGRVIGRTTYCNIEADHRRLEIGGTWRHRELVSTTPNRLFLWRCWRVARCMVFPAIVTAGQSAHGVGRPLDDSGTLTPVCQVEP
jgi:hypothetical protein